MVQYFSAEKTVLLLKGGEFVRIKPKSDPVLDSIADLMAAEFPTVRWIRSENDLMCSLWSIRQTEACCLPFVFFDLIDDYKLWQNFMLFDRFREGSELCLPALLIGTRDIFGPELGGKSNNVLGEKVIHLEDI